MPLAAVVAKATWSQKVEPNSVTCCSATTLAFWSGVPPVPVTVPEMARGSASCALATRVWPTTTESESAASSVGLSFQYSATWPAAWNRSR